MIIAWVFYNFMYFLHTLILNVENQLWVLHCYDYIIITYSQLI